jgi:hypothetical protein
VYLSHVRLNQWGGGCRACPSRKACATVPKTSQTERKAAVSERESYESGRVGRVTPHPPSLLTHHPSPLTPPPLLEGAPVGDVGHVRRERHAQQCPKHPKQKERQRSVRGKAMNPAEWEESRESPPLHPCKAPLLGEVTPWLMSVATS